MDADRPEYGETWVYEGIVGAVPGLELDWRTGLALQFLFFEGAVLVLAWLYGLWTAGLVGTVAVVVATVGSAQMVRIARRIRREPVPDSYSRLLFGSNVEVVLAVFAYSALVTYLFVLDPRRGDAMLVTDLLGAEPPLPAVYVFLLVVWDVCYRIGAAWWASVAGLWRSLRYRFDETTRVRLRRADVETAVFGVVQLAFVPFLLGQPILLVLLVGHVLAVLQVTALAAGLLRGPDDPAAIAHARSR